MYKTKDELLYSHLQALTTQIPSLEVTVSISDSLPGIYYTTYTF